MLRVPDLAAMLPFDLPLVTRGFSELTAAAAAIGAQAAERGALALGALLSCDVRLVGRALPGHWAEGAACARLGFDLPALPGTAVLEIDPAIVARAVDRLAGGSGEVPGATTLTPMEASALELMALAVLDAFSQLDPIERALSPRLIRQCRMPESPLCIALDVQLGSDRGRARLLVPPPAVRALRRRPELSDAVARSAVECSARQGAAWITPADLDGLRIGDVLLLDPAPAGQPCGETASVVSPPGCDLILPGGQRIRGRIAGDVFQVEGIS